MSRSLKKKKSFIMEETKCSFNFNGSREKKNRYDNI